MDKCGSQRAGDNVGGTKQESVYREDEMTARIIDNVKISQN